MAGCDLGYNLGTGGLREEVQALRGVEDIPAFEAGFAQPFPRTGTPPSSRVPVVSLP